MTLRDYFKSLLSNPNVQRALSLISKAEGADYFTLVGEGTNNKGLLRYGTSKHPKLLGFKGVYNPRVNDYSTAAGRYQIVGNTWFGLQRKGVVGDAFTPQEQDIAAIALIAESGALNDVLSGNPQGFISKTKGVWESFKLRGVSTLLSYWNGATGTTTGDTSNYSYSTIGTTQKTMINFDEKTAKEPIPASWRGLIVLMVGCVVLYLVLDRAGYV